MTAVALIQGNLTADHYEDSFAKDERIDILREKFLITENVMKTKKKTKTQKLFRKNIVMIILMQKREVLQIQFKLNLKMEVKQIKLKLNIHLDIKEEEKKLILLLNKNLNQILELNLQKLKQIKFLNYSYQKRNLIKHQFMNL